MPSLQTHNQSGRKKLVITKEPEAKQITGKDNKPLNFIEFMAKVEGEDSVVKYSSWTKALSDLIKLNATIDCDVVVTEQKQADPDGNPYKNRKITQIYQDGNAVKEQGGSGWKGKSPETVAMELDSKARNTALMQACELSKAAYERIKSEGRIISIEEVLAVADKMYAWLKGEKTPEKPVVKGIVQPAKREAVLPVVVSSSAVPDHAQDEAEVVSFVAEIQELLDAVNWREKAWRSWIKMQFRTDTTGSLVEVLARLDPNQTNMLRNHLTELKGLK